ncbi:hypothetical protein A2818_02395 [Candidatus Nomurabacteria bacterium RIFCSPHIGHO2_01_FULL_40_12]|uniref:Glycerophosphoryl diester phosphodiesterase membrane domain-containing protein n=1 Tax=Candidatus Nomurabacteria bacterium RIFCSPHIGHO2_01_FULL_40_12 TaxID=1801737 RepID=A0A1F6UYS3_9BACT|nr:MAG: hypothetical protein A2818_02395 [Candidatus Nomurabacteria bacterium RIFCSPHIGHO2_01_FULL_40_12]
METSFKLPPIDQLIREAWKIYSAKFSILFVLTLPFLFWSIVDVYLDRTYDTSFIIFASLFVLFILVVFTQAALFGNLANNGSFSLALKTFPKYLWTDILTSLILTTGLFLFIIPGLIWIFWFAFSVPIIADEGISGMKSLLKSREYMRGHFLQIFGRFIVLIFIIAIPAIIFSILTKHYPLFLYVQSIYGALILPISYAYLYNLYQHIKSNKPTLNPLGPGTGFKIAAWVGLLMPVVIIVLVILLSLSQVFIPGLQHSKDIQNTNYTISPSDISNILDGQPLSDYVISELKRGVAESDIRSELAKKGWQQQSVDQVFRSIKVQ